MNDIPEWRRLIQSALADEENVHTATYCQLATVDLFGHPRVRTMVWRGFDELDHALLMCTDAQSSKCDQLSNDDKAEIAWYLTDARQEFRFSGFMQCLNAKNDEHRLRSLVWSQLSDKAKTSFLDNLIANKLIDRNDNDAAVLASNVAHLNVPDEFTVLKFHPKSVTRLDLRSEPHAHHSWQLDSLNWI